MLAWKETHDSTMLMDMMEKMHREKVEKGSDVTIEFSVSHEYVTSLLVQAKALEDSVDSRYVWRVEFCENCRENDPEAPFHFFLAKRHESP